MNLSMQIRRSFFTLSLAAAAIVFVAAKASTGAVVHVQIPPNESVHAETVSVPRNTFTSPSTVAPARLVVPMIATKEHVVRKMVRTRCESVTNG